VLSQPLPQTIEEMRRRRRSACKENADPIDLPRRLRLGGERRGEEGASKRADEGSPIHHSIT
jgi:hypothetical protein